MRSMYRFVIAEDLNCLCPICIQLRQSGCRQSAHYCEICMQLTPIVPAHQHHFVISNQIRVYLVQAVISAVIQPLLVAIISVWWNVLTMMIAQNAREGHFVRWASRSVLNAYRMMSVVRRDTRSVAFKITVALVALLITIVVPRSHIVELTTTAMSAWMTCNVQAECAKKDNVYHA